MGDTARHLYRQQSTTEQYTDTQNHCMVQYYTPEELLQVNTSTEFLETATPVMYFKVKRGTFMHSDRIF